MGQNESTYECRHGIFCPFLRLRTSLSTLLAAPELATDIYQHDSVNETHPRGHVQWWEGGLYENEYLKENGVWKLFRYRYFPFWHAEFESGWVSIFHTHS